MATYELIVQRGERRVAIPLIALDDKDAVMSAIPVILDRAHKSVLWAKGSILLLRPDGTLLEQMEEKE